LLTEAVPKNEFITLKLSHEELEKSYLALTLEKTQLEGEVHEKCMALESAVRDREELENKVSALTSDIDDMAKDSKILDEELLGKQLSSPFRCSVYLRCVLLLTIFWPLQNR